MISTSSADKVPDTKPAKNTRDTTLSADGKWRSFPKVPNLVQYVSTGTYFGKVKIGGKPFRESLGTDVFTTAKLLLGDWIKKKRKRVARPVAGTFGEARALFEADLQADHIAPRKSTMQHIWCERLVAAVTTPSTSRTTRSASRWPPVLAPVLGQQCQRVVNPGSTGEAGPTAGAVSMEAAGICNRRTQTACQTLPAGSWSCKYGILRFCR
jgi:hypothetical protein